MGPESKSTGAAIETAPVDWDIRNAASDYGKSL
jgi:hypothetical protein